jgi:hypothetical protein
LQDFRLSRASGCRMPLARRLQITRFLTETNLTTLLSNSLSGTSVSKRMAVEIGGISLGLWCERGMRAALDPEHKSFISSGDASQTCDVELDISAVTQISLPSVAPCFSSGGLWSAYTAPTGTQFYFSTPTLGSEPYKAAWFDPTFSRGHIVLNRILMRTNDETFPLEYPVDELTMMHRLALGAGVELHALGLADRDGSGYLFVGHSGAGKSTTARLWMAEHGVRLLSDDRIILRKHDGDFWMYGTPWHGDAGVASQGRALLSSIFLLEHFPRNEIVPMAPPQAAAELFARAFVPHYLGEGIDFTLGFLESVAQTVSCSTLRFTPTKSAVEAIRHARA